MKDKPSPALETIIKNDNFTSLNNFEMNSFRNKVHKKEIENSPGGHI